MAKHMLTVGDTVTILKDGLDIAGPTKRPIVILHQDKFCIVAAKPSGILSCGNKSLETLLQTQLQQPALRAVHRLDRDTSGCLLFSCDTETHEKLISAFRAKTVSKVYHALVHGAMKRGEQRVSKPIGGQTAVSNVRVLDVSGSASHVAVSIETGRTHQIRIHLASIRHPVMGDRKYASGIKMSERLAGIPRQTLHAQALRFRHPITDAPLRMTAPLPADFKACMKTFKLT
jgi:23S rRNA pseudouridine1911/1915/1917 synthase